MTLNAVRDDLSHWGRPDAPCPVLPGLVSATSEEVAAANKAQGRKGAARFAAPDEAADKARTAMSAVADRLDSWVSHPDERVPLALLANRRLSDSDTQRKVLNRALASANSVGVLWTQLLEQVSRVGSRGYGRRGDAVDAGELRASLLADDGPVAAWLDAQEDPARVESITGMGEDWRALAERHGVLSDAYVRERVKLWLEAHPSTPLPFFANSRLTRSQALHVGQEALRRQDRRAALRSIAFAFVPAGHPLADGLMDALVHEETEAWEPDAYNSYQRDLRVLPSLWELPLTTEHVQRIIKSAISKKGSWDSRIAPISGLAEAGYDLPDSLARSLRKDAFEGPLGIEPPADAAEEEIRLDQALARAALLAFPESLEQDDLAELARRGIGAREAEVLVAHPKVNAFVLEQVALRVAPGDMRLASALLEVPGARSLPEVRSYIAATARSRAALLEDADPEEFAAVWRAVYTENPGAAASALKSASPDQREALGEEHWRRAADDVLYVRLPIENKRSYSSYTPMKVDQESPHAASALVRIPDALEHPEVQEALLPRIRSDADLLTACIENAPAEFALRAFHVHAAHSPATAFKAAEGSERLTSLLSDEDLLPYRSAQDPEVRTSLTMISAHRSSRQQERVAVARGERKLAFQAGR